jgi:hypothetical protein
MGPSVWLGIIGGAVFGAVAYGQLGPENVRGAVGAVVGGFIGVLGGTLIGVIAGLSLSGVAWLLGKK